MAAATASHLDLVSAGQHHVREDGIGRDFLRHHRSDAAGSDYQRFTHRIIRF